MNMYAKFQLHPPYSFWGEDFFENLHFMLLWQPIKFSDLKFILIVEDYSRNISVKKKKKKTKPEAHGPQHSLECIAMKAIFSQNTVNVACKRKINLSFAMATNQIQQFRLNSYGC